MIAPTKAEMTEAFDLVHSVFPGTAQYVWPLLAERLGCELWVARKSYPHRCLQNSWRPGLYQ